MESDAAASDDRVRAAAADCLSAPGARYSVLPPREMGWLRLSETVEGHGDSIHRAFVCRRGRLGCVPLGPAVPPAVDRRAHHGLPPPRARLAFRSRRGRSVSPVERRRTLTNVSPDEGVAMAQVRLSIAVLVCLVLGCSELL